jgi:hypothetical protein
MRCASMLVVMLGLYAAKCNTPNHMVFQNKKDSTDVFLNDTNRIQAFSGTSYLQLLNKRVKRRIAAGLAFPFPFGITGLHRVYLGTSPHVPVVYMATLGGALGILPFIDFCLLIHTSNVDAYSNRNRVFIWQP